MSIKVTWHCDGCDDTKDMTGKQSGDWKTVTVTLEGVEGYPLFKGAEEPRSYQLCPACIRKLHHNMMPRQWARAEKGLMA